VRRVLFITFDGSQSLDLMGPLEVFLGANEFLEALGRGPEYRMETVGLTDRHLRLSNGVQMIADLLLREVRAPIDTLFVVGGHGARAAAHDVQLQNTLKRHAPRLHRIASVCTGAYCLAAAGLLADRRAVTHWAWCDDFQRAYPTVHVEADRLFVVDGNVWTSAGVTAGIDMTLAMVEADLGRECALQIARHLVVFLKRSGGQSQYSAALREQLADHDGIRKVQTLALRDPERLGGVSEMARVAGMSPRNFARVFQAQLGETPARFVQRAKLERAKTLLLETRHSLPRIAAKAGFGSDETLRRLFVQHFGVTPTSYRRRFA